MMHLTGSQFLRWHQNDVIHLSPLCSTEFNMFTPLFAVHDGTYISRGTNKGILYHPFIMQSYRDDRGRRTVDNVGRMLFPAISNGDKKRYWVNGKYYYTLKHMLFQVDNLYNFIPLFTFAFETNYLIETLSKGQQLQESKGFFIVNRKFFDDSENGGLRRRLMSYIGDSPAHVLFTEDIKGLCFNDSVKVPTFNTIIERIDYIEHLKTKLNGTN